MHLSNLQSDGTLRADIGESMRDGMQSPSTFQFYVMQYYITVCLSFLRRCFVCKCYSILCLCVIIYEITLGIIFTRFVEFSVYQKVISI